ncbi:uncharacterized protein METZ01_LOCUS157680 [marine metagenome]|uniref:Uncharacterized protein n=1 Tax=marine metagenome TaxID=408172 RepID=A0A382ATG4_9ZZZZ
MLKHFPLTLAILAFSCCVSGCMATCGG